MLRSTSLLTIAFALVPFVFASGAPQAGGAAAPKRVSPGQTPPRKAPDFGQPRPQDPRQDPDQGRVPETTPSEEAERAARSLEAVAEEAERLAEEANAVAKRARKRAIAARKRVNDLVAARPGTPKAPPVLPRSEMSFGLNVHGPTVAEIHRATERPAAANKKAYLTPKRAGRVKSPARVELRRTLTYSPGEAPDLADIDVYAEWQWAINIARGQDDFYNSAPGEIARNGHIDYARLTIQPDPATYAGDGMNWGMRRHNLGDVTVVDCDFTGIPKEHGIYDALSGHGLYRGNTFQDLGGQAIQIAHRDTPFQQYKADNLKYASPPLIVVEDCHAVDCGKNAARSGFAWTFFDPGNPEFPGTVILRGCTSVHRWGFTRTSGGQMVEAGHAYGVRSPGGLVVHHYKPLPKDFEGHPTRSVVVDRCLFDFTRSEMPIAALRGVETILIEDSCFIARDHKNPVIAIDGVDSQRSGTVILENNVSPEEHRVWLEIRGKRVCHMHCPGKRLEIDVATRKITEYPMAEDPLTELDCPLASRQVAPGIHKQPAGHMDHLGALNLPGIESAKGRN